MAREVVVQPVYKTVCDFCRKETNVVVQGTHNVTTGYVGQGTDQHECYLSINVAGVIPYASGTQDVCPECFKNAALRIYNDITKEKT